MCNSKTQGPMPTVKYAVRIWGIKQDVDRDGKVLGLTFGPALGEDYRNNHISCGSKHCIHNMAWEDIIAQSREDPTVFQSCLEHGCTKPVPIVLNEKLANPGFKPQEWDGDGDGVGALFLSLEPDMLKWNWALSNVGGWPASRIRATLNGADSLTGTYAGSDLCDDSNSLLSCFPYALQGAIVAKAVKSDTVYTNTSSNNVTTYDKLWLFSGRELYASSVAVANSIRPNEGTPYQWGESHITANPSNKFIHLTAYYEDGYAGWWWLRSVSRAYAYYAYGVRTSGYGYDGDGVYNYYGFAPGFCLK